MDTETSRPYERFGGGGAGGGGGGGPIGGDSTATFAGVSRTTVHRNPRPTQAPRQRVTPDPWSLTTALGGKDAEQFGRQSIPGGSLLTCATPGFSTVSACCVDGRAPVRNVAETTASGRTTRSQVVALVRWQPSPQL